MSIPVLKPKGIRRIRQLATLSLLEGLLVMIVLLLIPSEKSSGIFWGYSKARLLMISAVLFVVGLLASGLILLKWKSNFSRNLHAKLNQLPEKAWWALLLFCCLLLLLISFFLLQWVFVAADEFLRAYLQRLTPLMVYGLLICLQGIVFVRGQLDDQKAIWKFRIFVLGFLTLLPWLLVGEYFIADSAFPIYYVEERYQAAFRIVLPLALFVTALYGQFLYYVLRQRLEMKISLGWGIAILFVILGYYYYNAAMHHSEKINKDPIHSDQGAYMEFAREAYRSNFSYTGVRNQMPLYPYLQALFYQPEMGDAAFFDQGKRVNVILSFVLLAGLFLVFQNYLSLHRSTILTLVVAVGLFIFKSAYFTAELLYYSLSFLGLLGMGLILLSSSLFLGVVTGIPLGLTYLTKASILPAIAAFVVAFAAKETITFINDRRANQRSKSKDQLKRLASLFLVLISFLAVCFPYLRENKQKYGRYFYNVNSTFYIWYDTWAEAIADTAEYGYREHWPDMPDDQIPSWRNYLRDHTLEEIKTRLFTGFKKQAYYLTHSYSRVNYIWIYSVVALLMLPGVGMAKLISMMKTYFPLLLFVLLNFFGYLLLFAWYFPIAGGPRFFMDYFCRRHFFSFVATDKLSANLRAVKTDSGFAWLGLVDAIVLATLLVDFAYVITLMLPTGYFGS